MPRLNLSDKCVSCLERREFNQEMCPADCPEGLRITRTYDQCFADEGLACRHYNACEQNPLTCGYWTNRTYPIEVA